MQEYNEIDIGRLWSSPPKLKPDFLAFLLEIIRICLLHNQICCQAFKLALNSPGLLLKNCQSKEQE